jgi:hypothetical protein
VILLSIDGGGESYSLTGVSGRLLGTECTFDPAGE